MSLSTQKVSVTATPGMAAAATAHSFGGGRGVASALQNPVESGNFSTQVGVNDNAIVYSDDQGNLDPNGKRRESFGRETQTAFMARRALAYTAILMDQAPNEGSSPTGFSDILTKGIRGYERTQGLINSGLAPVGSAINQLS